MAGIGMPQVVKAMPTDTGTSCHAFKYPLERAFTQMTAAFIRF
jgi:hypothetical protein